jgi:hypothetical protein
VHGSMKKRKYPNHDEDFCCEHSSDVNALGVDKTWVRSYRLNIWVLEN